MRLSTHIAFDGQCEAAFTLYAQCFGGTITSMLTYGASPMAPSAGALAAKIVHATFNIGDQTLTGADVAPEAYHKPEGFAVQVNVDDPAEARRIYSILADGGAVALPLQQTFWAAHYAVLTDRFGTPWKINCA